MRPFASLPHPGSGVVEETGTLYLITAEWLQKLQELVDLIPLSGTVDFSAATTAAVTFASPELNTDYNVVIEAPEDQRVWITAKSTTGFTINVSAVSSATYGWTIVRR